MAFSKKFVPPTVKIACRLLRCHCAKASGDSNGGMVVSPMNYLSNGSFVLDACEKTELNSKMLLWQEDLVGDCLMLAGLLNYGLHSINI